MEVGIDLVEIENLQHKIERTPNFLAKMLTPNELATTNATNSQTLAGKIAAKEAIIKTGYARVGEWQKIQILADDTGKPRVYTTDGRLIEILKISISHTDKYAVAMAVLC